jgi:hypothetical protein
MSGPVAPSRSLLAAGERAMGSVEVVSALGRDTVVLGRSAAREGVLFGRYERCDSHGLQSLGDCRVSRVHCLVVELDGQLHAVDVASQNGLYVQRRAAPSQPPALHRVRSVPLCSGDELSLGSGVNLLRWRAGRPDRAESDGSLPIIVSPLVH